MKFKLFIAIVAILLTSNFVKGQFQTDQVAFSSSPIQRDSLIIERQDGQKIKLIWPYSKNVKKEVEWEQLFDDFQSDFGKVADNIPVYKFYSITYYQKKNLVVDEVRGKETYTVNEKNGMDYVNSNICKLYGEKIQLSVEFSDYKELLDPSLKAEIETALTHIKNKLFSALSSQRHFFDVNSKSMLPNPKPKFKFFIPLGAKLGLLKNQPYIELRPGIGLMQNKQYYYALNWNIMTQYNNCLLYTSPSPRDATLSRMPSSA